MSDTPRMKLARIVHALLTNPNGLRYDDMMEKFQIKDRRTLRDYMDELKRMNELVRDGEHQVVFSGRGESRRIALKISSIPEKGDVGGHVLSLYFSLCMIRFLKGTKLEDRARKLYESLYKGANTTQFLHLEKKIYSLNEWPKDYSQKTEIVKKCVEALIYQKVLRIHYRPPGIAKKSVSRHDLKIYTLLHYRNGLYLLAKSDRGDHVILFAVERVTRAETLRQSFHYPAGFSPQDYFDGAFGLYKSNERHQVVVNFDASLKTIIEERQWHPTSKIRTLKNGTLQLTMTVSSFTQVVPWVLSFGPNAKVVKPKQLKDRVREEITGMAELYKSKKSS